MDEGTHLAYCVEMPDDNIIKFRRPKKKPPPRQAGKPSLVVAAIVAAVTIALVVGITMLFGADR
ncbi:MAG: hypothetical protein ABI398_07180 [Devosia sp.]